MKKYFILLIVLYVATPGKAQQLQSSSFYDMQGVIVNPSTAGVQKYATIGGTYRTQWSAVSGAPKTATLFGSFALPQYNIGLGGYIYTDKTGPTSRNGINLAFAKHI